MKNEIDHCQYCYLHYDNCTCCDKCGSVKDACDCKEDGPTIMNPSDAYRAFYKNPKVLEDIFGITDMVEVDKWVMRGYIKSSWPERLKKE